jgi:hypothetical protein
MSSDFKSFSGKWVVENKTYTFYLAPTLSQFIQLVPLTEIQGKRKVKNFRISLSVTSDEAVTEQHALWVLAHLAERMPGQPVPDTVSPEVDHSCPVWNTHDSVIASGAENGFSNGRPIYVPLSRLIDSGDCILFVVRNMTNAINLKIAAAVSYAICYG